MVAQRIPNAQADLDEFVSTSDLENRPLEGIDKERLAPAVLQLVAMLFAEEGVEFLALLCRLATEKQLSLFARSGETSHVAVITFHGILDLVTTPGWKWGRETTLKILQVLEALTVLVRFRRAGYTEIHLPLGLRVLNQTEILANLERCVYTNKKTRQLVKRVKNHLLRYGIPVSEDEGRHDVVERPEVGLLVHELLAVLEEEQIPAAKRKRIALWYASELVRRGMRDYLDTLASHKSDSPPRCSPCTALLESDIQEPESPSASSQGSLSAIPRRQNRPSVSEEGRAAGDVLPSESPSVLVQAPPRAIVSAKNRPAPLTLLAHEGDSSVGESPSDSILPAHPDERGEQMGDSGARIAQESPVVAEKGPAGQPEGDSGSAFSRIDSFSLEKGSLRDDLDLEATADSTAVPSESPSSANEGELRAEAIRYIALLDGPNYATAQYLHMREGKRLLGGYMRKLHESPALSRVSLVSALMQQHFAETTKHGPLKHAGKWFHQSFKRYADREHPMEMSGEIASWAESAYTIEQIALALRLERERQDGQWQVPLHRPFASCVQSSPLFERMLSPDDESVTPESLACPLTGEQAEGAGKRDRQAGGESEEPSEMPASLDAGDACQGGEEAGRVYVEVDEHEHELGWLTPEAVVWWCEQLAATPLAHECRMEVLPTQYGRFVLVVTAQREDREPWMWVSGREVRAYLEAWRAANCRFQCNREREMS